MSATLTLSPAADLFVSSTPFALEHGESLASLELGYELIGPIGAPVVAVQGGISAHPHVACSGRDGAPGWWPAIAGGGRALDTTRFRLLSLEFVGKRQAAVVSSGDQARATALLLDELGIDRLHAFVGASYGGMVALRFGELFPDRVERIVAISAADRSLAFATAWRSLQRELLHFGERHGAVADSVALARSLAMLSYRSPQELEERFAGPPRACEDGALRFPVAEWLHAKGREFATRFEAGAYARLSQAIDLHRADVTRIRARTTLIGADPDLLIPFAQLEALAAAFKVPARLERIASRYGHDAFLKETAALAPLIFKALDERVVEDDGLEGVA
jgi:homoserine O-acetyltransferase